MKSPKKSKPVPVTPPAPAPVRQSKAQPVGTVVTVSSSDLAVLKALGDAMAKGKAQAFDQCMAVLVQAKQTLDPIDQEFRTRAKAAAVAAGAQLDGDSEWKFVLEDGTFTRSK